MSPQRGPSLQVAADPSVDLTETRLLVTVMFADLSGSTSLGERLDPEDLRRVLTAFFSALAQEIQRFGGTIDKYIGDAVMAVFGAPVSHEDDAERAISAAIAMHAAIGRLNEDLEQRHGTRLALRIGINTGEVVAGLLGGDVLGAYTVVGDTVNTAQRFESKAEPGTILVSQASRDLTRRTFDFEDLPPVVMRGKAEPQPAFRVLGVRSDSPTAVEPPLVGRSSELSQLVIALEAAGEGRGSAIHLVGDAGIGKSRLVRELRRGAAPGVQLLVGRCVSFENERPYALIARMLRNVVRIALGQEEAVARAALERMLRTIGRTVDLLDTALLLEVLGYGERSQIDPLTRQRILVRLLRRMLVAFTERAPLLIVAEDLHWADPASASVLAELARDVPARRCLLLSTGRPGALPQWQADVLTLEALPESGARALVEAAFGAPVETSLSDAILARTGGNPFFIEEVARGLSESDVLIENEGRIAARPDWTPRVPATVQEVLEARLDRLPTGPRRTLSVAAVCGRLFRGSVVHHVVQENGESLALLERESFVLPQPTQLEPTYVFRHALIQEVAYNRQLQSQRRTTHAAIGEAVETMYADRLDEMVGELAFHYGRSDNDEKAVYWLIRAGDRARSLYANSEALTQYQAALERATDGPGPENAAAILERIGEVQTLIGRYDEAIDTYRSALERVVATQGSAVARIMRRQGTALLLKGAYAETEATLDQALAALGTNNDPEAARIALQIGQLHYRRGEFERARAALEGAIELGTRFDLDDLLAEGLKQLGNVAVDTGDLRVADAEYQRSRGMYERLEDILGLADIHSNLGIIYRRTRRWEEALAEYDASLSLYQRMGHQLGIGRCYNNIAEVLRTRGDTTSAVPAYQQAIETWSSIGNAAGVAVALVGLGMARVESGDVKKGRADLLEAEQRLTNLGSTRFLPDVYRYLAVADLADGDVHSAEKWTERSLEFARAGQALHQEAATLRVLGEVFLARGDPESARPLLEISRQTLASLGDTLELARTEGVLERLTKMEQEE